MIEILNPSEIERARATGALVGTILQTLRDWVTVGTNLLDVDSLDISRGASTDAAVATAAHHVLVALAPAQQATLDAALAATLAAVPDGAAEDEGVRAGEAAASVDAAIALVLQDCREIMDTIASGPLNEAQRARNKGDLGFASRLVARASDLLFESASQNGLANNPYFHRMWRDIQAGTKHISMNFDMTMSLYGRVALGLPAGTAQF